MTGVQTCALPIYREILYDCTLVTGEFVDGLTDQTIYEYAAERFPLRGLTEKGY